MQLLGLDRKIVRCPVEAVAEVLRAPLAAPISADVEQLLIQAQVPVYGVPKRARQSYNLAPSQFKAVGFCVRHQARVFYSRCVSRSLA